MSIYHESFRHAQYGRAALRDFGQKLMTDVRTIAGDTGLMLLVVVWDLLRPTLPPRQTATLTEVEKHALAHYLRQPGCECPRAEATVDTKAGGAASVLAQTRTGAPVTRHNIERL